MGDFVIKEKLKILKVSLKRWNKEVFGWYNLKVDEGVGEINVLDKLLFSCVDVEVKELVDRRSKVISSTWRNLSIRDNMLIQKSRAKWKDGYLNSQYFHNLIKGRARMKFIGDVNIVSGVVDSVEEVKDVIWNFFNQKFRKPDHVRHVLEGSVFYKIGDQSQTHFRSANWCGNTPLAYLFLDLFALNNVKGAFDATVSGKVDSTHYSTCLDYKCFMESKVQVIMEEDMSMAFRTLWNWMVLAKIKAFGWRVFLNRLATKDQLIKRGLCLVNREGLCVLCLQSEEDLNHHFFDCSVLKKVWELIGFWIGYSLSLIGPPWKQFLSWSRFLKTFFNKGKFEIIWLADAVWRW
ncbi:hypothetical protein KIW84_051139 [Lathyrus oleraceus]|uniref:Reverse transcriptase zinc-binding domain-containing protein n=1 Tax=Pisum sativum TaxID=3888 RepID=A0A9D4WLQ1_PEA|nr:hypothetical protein KIW84_051139 [Pisum sativum]